MGAKLNIAHSLRNPLRSGSSVNGNNWFFLFQLLAKTFAFPLESEIHFPSNFKKGKPLMTFDLYDKSFVNFHYIFEKKKIVQLFLGVLNIFLKFFTITLLQSLK